MLWRRIDSVLCLICTVGTASGQHFGFGVPASHEEVSGWDIR